MMACSKPDFTSSLVNAEKARGGWPRWFVQGIAQSGFGMPEEEGDALKLRYIRSGISMPNMFMP